jgi:hypothetical protein
MVFAEENNKTPQTIECFLHEIKILEKNIPSFDLKNSTKSNIVDNIDKLSLDNFLSKFRYIQMFLVNNQDIEKDHFKGTKLKRNDTCELYLVLLKTIRKVMDTAFKPNYNLPRNVRPPLIEGEKVTKIMFAGMPPDVIESPKVREEYLKLKTENLLKQQYQNTQMSVRELYDRTQADFVHFVLDNFKAEPREYDIITNLLTIYEYPETEKIKLLCELNILYEGFREWQSTDKLFKTNAKFISLDKGDIILEKADGKRTTIEFSVLRKEDQDYVKEQLNPETKTPKNETTKD